MEVTTNTALTTVTLNCIAKQRTRWVMVHEDSNHATSIVQSWEWSSFSNIIIHATWTTMPHRTLLSSIHRHAKSFIN